MANDKNTTNELVAEDDDPTVELEMLADTYDFIGQKREEVDPSITELESDLQSRSETTNQRQSGELASAKAEVRELRTQLDHMESYADDIRQKLQERTSLTDRAENTRENLRYSLDRVTQQVEQLENDLEEARASSEILSNLLVSTRESHAEEIRIIRFELGEAQGTVTEHELLTEQLASDLVNTREFRDELERVLNETEEQTRSRIEELERENRMLKDDLAHNEEQLESKSEALNSLLTELAKKSQQVESIGEIEDVIHEIDDRVSERFDEHAHTDRDRVTRVLIGSVDGQELRFPLFKDRLTIGRTDQNDIQLQASYVSRRHAVIVSDRNATRIVDWGSKNGVFVNSERITEHFLRNGDNVTIGTAEFRYEERPKRDN